MNCEWFQEIFASFLKGYKTITSDTGSKEYTLLFHVFTYWQLYLTIWEYLVCDENILSALKQFLLESKL